MAPKDLDELEAMMVYAMKATGAIGYRYPRGSMLRFHPELKKVEEYMCSENAKDYDYLVHPAGEPTDDLLAMRGVWRDHLRAYDSHGVEVDHDHYGGVSGPFPYENLVYVDFDGSTYTQTNVTLSGRTPSVRTFEASVCSNVLTFRILGPEAPIHIGVSGGPGLIWFVPQSLAPDGIQRYSEPDLIRIDGDRRWRTTVLYRNAEFVRTMLVEGVRLTSVTEVKHALDPRAAAESVHAIRSSTDHYRSTATKEK